MLQKTFKFSVQKLRNFLSDIDESEDNDVSATICHMKCRDGVFKIPANIEENPQQKETAYSIEATFFEGNPRWT